MQKLDETIGLKNVMVWHCNDAKDPRGSGAIVMSTLAKARLGWKRFAVC